MADDAGALLVRSGLVASSALEVARAFVEEHGGTIGEALVHADVIGDDALTEFYCSRLLVPKVNPNSLARLSAKVVATIPAELAIELRAVPVSVDGENNLTVAMSDPSDRHAVDEIAFFTGAYVVRAVATQMQIAWCLAHYYGHVTALGQRLLQPNVQQTTSTNVAAAQQEAIAAAAAVSSAAAAASSQRLPRTKGVTSKVEAARHRGIAPITGPVTVQRPNSAVLDDPTPAPPISAPSPAASPTSPTLVPASSDGSVLGPRPRTASGEIRVPRAESVKPPMPIDDEGSGPVIVMEANEPDPDETPLPPAEPVAPPKPVRRRPIAKEDPPELAARTGEVVQRPPRAPTIERNDEEPSILIDQGALAPPSPPELADKSGEIGSRQPAQGGPKRRSEPANTVEIDPEIVDDDEAITLAPKNASTEDDDTARIHSPASEVESAPILLDRKRPSDPPATVAATPTPTPTAPKPTPPPKTTPPPSATVTPAAPRRTAVGVPAGVVPAAVTPARTAVISVAPVASAAVAAAAPDVPSVRTEVPDNTASFADDNLGDALADEIVVLTPKPPRLGAPPVAGDGARTKSQKRADRRTQIGMIPHAAITRALQDTAPAADGNDPGDAIPRAMTEADAPPTMQMSAIELDAAIPGRKATLAMPVPSVPMMVVPVATPVPAPVVAAAIAASAAKPPAKKPGSIADALAAAKQAEVAALATAAASAAPTATKHAAPSIQHDPVDDGWGPPGTTIPPPLLGAVPGSMSHDDDDHVGGDGRAIPMPDVDAPPLIVAPPAAPERAPTSPVVPETTSQTLARALEDSTSRALALLRKLETAADRNEVIDLLVTHLAESHRAAGFFAVKGGELALFTLTPKPATLPFASLRLDRPSTLQDVVGTRLPYRGPMHDQASRLFLASVLGAAPAEILLVPITIRERVVGVLFGEHRLRHTFDDQLALAARAAGMSLERLLQSKRR